jgi:hypothetical protein
MVHSGVSEKARVEDHLMALWPRLTAAGPGITTLTARSDSWGVLSLVRYFEEGDEDFDEATWGLPTDSRFERLGGQHPLLGFGFDLPQLQFLASMGLGIDVDEYG